LDALEQASLERLPISSNLLHLIFEKCNPHYNLNMKKKKKKKKLIYLTEAESIAPIEDISKSLNHRNLPSLKQNNTSLNPWETSLIIPSRALITESSSIGLRSATTLLR
jgi:hypothetical protein